MCSVNQASGYQNARNRCEHCAVRCRVQLPILLQKASVCRASRSGLEQDMASVSIAGCGWTPSRSRSLWAPPATGGSYSSRHRIFLMSLICFVWVYVAACVSEWLGHNRSVGGVCSVYCGLCEWMVGSQQKCCESMCSILRPVWANGWVTTEVMREYVQYIAACVSERLGHNRSDGRVCFVYCSVCEWTIGSQQKWWESMFSILQHAWVNGWVTTKVMGEYVQYIAACVSERLGHNRSDGRVCSVYCGLCERTVGSQQYVQYIAACVSERLGHNSMFSILQWEGFWSSCSSNGNCYLLCWGLKYFECRRGYTEVNGELSGRCEARRDRGWEK